MPPGLQPIHLNFGLIAVTNRPVYRVHRGIMGHRQTPLRRLLLVWVMLCVASLPLRALADASMHQGVGADTTAVDDAATTGHHHRAMSTAAPPCFDQAQPDDCCRDTACRCVLHVFALVAPLGMAAPDVFGATRPGLLALPAIPTFNSPVFRPP